MLDYQLVSCSSLPNANKAGYKRNSVVRVTDFLNDSCIYFPSLCGNINFQKLPVQFFRNSLKKEDE